VSELKVGDKVTTTPTAKVVLRRGFNGKWLWLDWAVVAVALASISQLGWPWPVTTAVFLCVHPVLCRLLIRAHPHIGGYYMEVAVRKSSKGG